MPKDIDVEVDEFLQAYGGTTEGKTPDVVVDIGENDPERPDPHRELYQKLATQQVRDEFIVPTLLWVALDFLGKVESKVVSDDLLIQIQRSLVLILKDQPFTTKIDLGRYGVHHANQIVKAIDGATVRETLLGICLMIVRLVEDAKLVNADSLAVLAAIAILAEAREDGVGGEWGWNEGRVAAAADRAHSKASDIGYFTFATS